MTYRPEDVEALVKAAKEVQKSIADLLPEHTAYMFNSALAALEPKPVMVYTMPEFDDVPVLWRKDHKHGRSPCGRPTPSKRRG